MKSDIYNPEDVMIDLETTGISAGCCVLSIGACTLDGTETFYAKINSAEQRNKLGLIDFPPTMDWWAKQPEKARTEAFGGILPPHMVLHDFNIWLSRLNIEGVWGNGAAFDLPILTKLYEAVNLQPSWPRFSDRCYRTVKNLYPEITPEKFIGTKHDALDDALYQAAHLRKILLTLER